MPRTANVRSACRNDSDDRGAPVASIDGSLAASVAGPTGVELVGRSSPEISQQSSNKFRVCLLDDRMTLDLSTCTGRSDASSCTRAVNERGSLTEEAAVRERAGMSMSWDACV